MNRKSFPHRILLFINIYSIDVVAGALFMGAFASRVLGVEASCSWYVVLATSVWVMYTADHLMDALKGKGYITIKRHIIHYHHRKVIIAVWVTAGLTAVLTALYKLDVQVIRAGIALGLVVGLYLTILYFNSHKRAWLLQKELFIAVVYVTGIWLAPVIWHEGRISTSAILVMANMMLLAWAEGILVSWYERNEDVLNGHTSFTTLFGGKAARGFVFILLIAVIIIALVSWNIYPQRILKAAFLIQFLMAFVLSFIIMFPSFFRKDFRYRYIGEITFWLPGLILWS